MNVSDEHSGDRAATGGTSTAWRPDQLVRRTNGRGPAAGTVSRWRTRAAWIGGAVALFAVLVRISFSDPLTSDAANNALQAWDLLHGHLLLPGWTIGDATYYTFELPLYAIVEAVVGLGAATSHLVAALTFVIVVACAVAVACTGSRGGAVVARCAVVLAIVIAPLVTMRGVAILLNAPDHFGTSAFLLVAALLIDRVPNWRYAAPLVGAVLCAGQLGDTTVRYLAVPAILLVCGYRVLIAGRLRTGDTAIALATVASVPLSALVLAIMRALGGYAMVQPPTRFSPASQWPQHAVLTFRALRILFGAMDAPGTAWGVAGAAFGIAALLAVGAGLARAAWTWRTASRAVQILCVVVVLNLVVYLVSTLPGPYNAREVAAVLPCGAVLAARAFVPERIARRRRARSALAMTALLAVLPLVAAVSRPTVTPVAAPVAAWLKAHRLSYGVAGYWDASAVTLQSGNQVQVRAVSIGHRACVAGFWETKADWYDAAAHDATFVIADPPHAVASDNLKPAGFERCFGRPAAIHRVAGRIILVYRMNLLKRLTVRPRA
jgi:hypothetical protein